MKLFRTIAAITSARQVTGAKNSVPFFFTIITLPCSLIFSGANLKLMKRSLLGFKFLFAWRRIISHGVPGWKGHQASSGLTFPGKSRV